MAHDWGDRPRPPYVGDERTTLDGWLDFHRDTLLRTCDGLTDVQLASRPVPSSGLTLLGLVRHMTDVERGWFLPFLGGAPRPTPSVRHCGTATSTRWSRRRPLGASPATSITVVTGP